MAISRSLTTSYDVLEMYTTLTTMCAQILDVDSVGLLVADDRGSLAVVAASSEHTKKLELFQLQCEQGPCLDCYRTGVPVAVPDLAHSAALWPKFVPTAVEAGFASVHATPMALHGTILGALGLFGSRPGILNGDDLALAQAFTDVAAVALVAAKAGANAGLVNAQLQTALTSRISLEQAKGIVAEHGALTMDQSFATLRRYSRDRNVRLSDLAHQVVTRELRPDLLITHARAKGVLTG
ncbi:MAG: GAF and ANTAR domain-containing protein [Sporichthyaceae bacterium]